MIANAAAIAEGKWFGGVQALKQPLGKSSDQPGLWKPSVASISSALVADASPPLAKFLQLTRATTLTNPVTVRAERVHMADKEMEPEKPYIVRYGKRTLVIRKTSDDKIHVHKIA